MLGVSIFSTFNLVRTPGAGSGTRKSESSSIVGGYLAVILWLPANYGFVAAYLHPTNSHAVITLRTATRKGKNIKTKIKTYNSRDSLVVTHPTTNRPACGLSTAERTGSPVLHTLWSYVLDLLEQKYMRQL